MNADAKNKAGGNITDKYNTRNPLFRVVMNNYFRAFENLILPIKNEIADVMEVGCGEGYVARRLFDMGFARVRANDVSDEIICTAREMNAARGIAFETKSVYDISSEDAADLVVCCEVFEHLRNPEMALEALHSAARKYCLMSVPREPLFRMLNVARGAYITQMGNTPGHIQHWTSDGFVRFVAKRFAIQKIRHPLPWTMVLCAPK